MPIYKAETVINLPAVHRTSMQGSHSISNDTGGYHT